MRLTKQGMNLIMVNKEFSNVMYQKLSQLEDIEEKHNIKSIDDLDNKLKALEIIKNKGLCDFTRHDFDSQEEYDLLKEVLND